MLLAVLGLALAIGAARSNAATVSVTAKIAVDTSQAWMPPGSSLCFAVAFVEVVEIPNARNYLARVRDTSTGAIFEPFTQPNDNESGWDDQWEIFAGGQWWPFHAPPGTHRKYLSHGGWTDCGGMVAYYEGLYDIVSVTAEVEGEDPPDENKPPRADFTWAPLEDDPLTVAFDGSGSADDVGIEHYHWDFGDGETAQGASEVRPEHTYAAPGTYPVTLTVFDGEDLYDSKALDVTVSCPPDELESATQLTTSLSSVASEGCPSPKKRPLALFSWKVNTEAALTIDFDASASSDPDGEIVEWRWDFKDGTTDRGEKVTHRFPTTGRYNVVLEVVDDDGLVGVAIETVVVGGDLIVNSTGDAGESSPGDGACETGGTILRGEQEEVECTLRAAIEEANANPGPDSILFDIPGDGTPTIAPGSALPDVTGTVSIDGTSQPGSWVRIDGVGAGDSSGIIIRGSGSKISGLWIVGFAQAALYVTGEGHRVTGSRFDVGFLATPPDRTALVVAGASDITIGGSTAAHGQAPGNWIRGRPGSLGMAITSSTAVRVLGNLIEGGFSSLDDTAIRVTGSSETNIGSAAADAGNTIIAGTGIEVTSTSQGAPVQILGNVVTAHLGVGVLDTAHDVRIGGSAPEPGTAPGNRITAGWGIRSKGTATVVSGNDVRHDDDDTQYRSIGIGVHGADSVVGGSEPSAANRVTGFKGDGGSHGFGVGIWVDAPAVTVRNNVVGVTADGSASGNGTGIRVNTTGTHAVVEDNVASGNTVGIVITLFDASESERAVVRGNRIGTNAEGSSAIPNLVGLHALGAVVGGAASTRCESPCNLISGNSQSGANLDHAVTFSGNFVGTSADGRDAIPNEDGVTTASGSAVVGGEGAGNLIAFNRRTGIVVRSVPATIRANRIHSNGALGIDHGGDGVTANDPFDEDGIQNFPVITSFEDRGSQMRVSGNVAVDLLGGRTVDLFWNRDCDRSGYGEGELYAGSATVPPLLGGFSVELDTVSGYPFLTATATGPRGTSEFSVCVDTRSTRRALGSAASRGSTRIDVPAAGLVDKVVGIGIGRSLEKNLGKAAGSLILAKPLRFDHEAGEPVVALDDTLFVSVDRATITRGGGPAVLRIAGTAEAIPGRNIACGDSVGLTINGTLVAARAEGARFQRAAPGRCAYSAAGRGGLERFELDTRAGTWSAFLVHRGLGELAREVDVGLRIGDVSGSELLEFTTSKTTWTYVR